MRKFHLAQRSWGNLLPDLSYACSIALPGEPTYFTQSSLALDWLLSDPPAPK